TRYSARCRSSRTRGAESANSFRVPHVPLSRQILSTESCSVGGGVSRDEAFSGSFAVIALISNSVMVGVLASFRLQVVYRRISGCPDRDKRASDPVAEKSRCVAGQRYAASLAPAVPYYSY